MARIGSSGGKGLPTIKELRAVVDTVTAARPVPVVTPKDEGSTAQVVAGAAREQESLTVPVYPFRGATATALAYVATCPAGTVWEVVP